MLRRSYVRRTMVVSASLACILFLLFLSNTVSAQSTSSQSTPDTPDTVEVVGSISGTVADSAGNPLENIRVELKRYAVDQWATDRSVQTDEAGHYEFRNLRTALYLVNFQDWNGTYVRHFYPNVTSPDAAEVISIVGNNVSGIDATMQRAGRISGRITITEAMERRGITVRFYSRQSGEWRHHSAIHVQRQAFRNDGNAAVAAYGSDPLFPGDYRICVEADAYGDVTPWGYFREYLYQECYGEAISLETGADIRVQEGANTDNIDFQFGDNSPLPAIAGNVTNKAGEPLPDIPVYLFERSEDSSGLVHELTRRVATDETGHYAIHEIPPGVYRIGYNLYSSGTFSTNVNYASEYHDNQRERDQATLLNFTADTTGLTVDAVLSRTGSISGVIAFIGDVIPESVRIVAEDLSSANTVGRSFDVDSNTVAYQLDGVPAGVYRVYASAILGSVNLQTYYDDRVEPSDALPVAVTAGATTPNINFQLEKQNPVLGSIRGVITSSAGPLQGPVSVCARGTEHNSTHCVDLTENGIYQLFNLLPDTYTVCVGGRYINDRYEETCYQSGSSAQLVLEAGADVAGIDIAVETTGFIQGNIRIADGRSIHTVQLTVYEWNETRQRWQVVSDTELSQIYFQDPENYIVGQLNTGVYRLCINATGWGVDGNGERFVTCYGDTDNVELATDIAVTYGQATTGIDFVLEDRAAGRIEGTVLADGAPQSGVEVELYAVDQDTTTWWRMVYVETDTDGRYRIDGLESGEYRVRFVDPNDVFTSIVYGGGFSIETGQSIVLETGAVMADVDANLLVFDEQIYLPLVTR